MTWLTWIFGESPRALAALLFPLAFFTLVWWRRGGSSRPFLAVLVLTPILFALQSWVETRREIAARLLTALENDTVAGRTEILARLTSNGFSAGELRRAEFLDLAEARLKSHAITAIERFSCEQISASADRFAVRCRYRIFGSFGSVGPGGFGCTVEFEFSRDGQEWKLSSIPPPTIATMQFRSWVDATAR